MKKICIVTTVSVTMKSFVVETAKYLYEKRGYDVTLICAPDEAFAASLPDYLHYIPVDMPRGADPRGFLSVKTFRKIFREQKFDLVQYSTPNASCYASIAAKLEKIPVRLYCQWGIRYVGLSGISRTIFKFLEKLVCTNSTHIRAVSPLNRLFAIEEGLYPGEKAYVVGNGGTIGVDMASYRMEEKEQWRQEIRQKYAIDEKDIVFGFVGRVSIDKGCQELLQAFRKLAEKESRAKLMLIGSNECENGPLYDLLRWAQESDQVVITGNIPGSDMKQYYAALDVLTHPTYREGFGMVIQEAGALAIPTITTKIPGASEVMKDGVSCLLVEPKNETDLLTAMQALCDNEEKRLALGQAAYDRTKKLYDRPIMLEHQLRDYVKLLGEQ